MRERYGEAMAQSIADDIWITEVSGDGLVILSKDYRMRTDHLEVIRACRAKVFLLPDAQMRSADQCSRYVDNRYRIALKAQRDGPQLHRVDKRGLTDLLR
jgi:hypothetical protein